MYKKPKNLFVLSMKIFKKLPTPKSWKLKKFSFTVPTALTAQLKILECSESLCILFCDNMQWKKILSFSFFRMTSKVKLMASLLSRGPLVWFLVHAYHLVFVCLIWGSGRPVSANSYPGNGIIQNPVVSCQDVKKKILCLPLEYSKFDLPYRNEHNLIDIGK